MQINYVKLHSCLLSAMLCAMGVNDAYAGKSKHKGKTVTLMQFQDMHGHLAPHAEILPDGRMDPNSGGIAKVTTLIKQVRADSTGSLLLAVGDTTHGSAETTFSLGDSIMPALNSLGIDAFLPGNWDFGYGPRVYRQRFVEGDFSTALAPNNRTTIAWMDGKPGHEGQQCNTAGGLTATTYDTCHVTKANFPTIAINLYNASELTGAITGQTHPGYIVKDSNGVKVGIIGVTSDVVPQQAQAFNTGFRFTMGYKELPASIAAAKAEGAEMIVVLSELGLAKNVQLVKEFPEINVMFSGHTHERTPEAIIIERDHHNIGIVTEAGEDSFLGRLDVQVSGGKITSYTWDLMEADSNIAEDPDMKTIIDQERKTFVAGDDFICHTFGPNAFPFGMGHVLCDPLETVVGHTNPSIERFDVLEEVANNVMVDAFLDLAQSLGEVDSKGNTLTDDNSLSQTNGFRFDTVVLGSDDGFSGDVTIGDLYDYYPIGAAGALAEFTGGRLIDHWENVLSNVFDPNPYRQRGGWFLGFTHNMHFDLELNDDFPRTITQGRIDSVTINGANFDRSKTYTLASCYPHGNPIDEVCRTSGATNVRYIQGTEMTSGPTDMFGHRALDINGPWQTTPPVNSENIFDPVRFADGGALFLKVAPDNFAHPTDALRRYLATHVIDSTTHGLGRVTAVTGVPASEYGGAGIVQPTQGAGPEWLKRIVSLFDD